MRECGARGWLSIIGCAVLLTACGGGLLRPASPPGAPMDLASGVTVTIAPVSDAPGWRPDDVRALQVYYAAVWVDIINRTTDRMAVDPARAIVYDANGTPWPALDSAQLGLVRRWHPWSWRTWWAEWFAGRRQDGLAARLEQEQLQAGWVAPGEHRSGLLIFKSMPASACETAELEWRGSLTSAARTLRVPMSCG